MIGYLVPLFRHFNGEKLEEPVGRRIVLLGAIPKPSLPKCILHCFLQGASAMQTKRSPNTRTRLQNSAFCVFPLDASSVWWAGKTVGVHWVKSRHDSVLSLAGMIHDSSWCRFEVPCNHVSVHEAAQPYLRPGLEGQVWDWNAWFWHLHADHRILFAWLWCD